MDIIKISGKPRISAVSAAIAGRVISSAHSNQSAARLAFETIRVKLSAGSADVDVYWPDTATPAPLVIVAHGFFRHRHNMSGWGQRLVNEGFAVAVPDLPAWSDHARNGRFISDLRTYLCAGESWRQRIDPFQVGLMGFSAGGLASLLSAADNPDLSIWVGLDPVDWNGTGAKAAPQVKCRAIVLTAEALRLQLARERSQHHRSPAPLRAFQYPGAVHVDAEWPTDWMAEAVCGRSTDERRSEFRQRATAALRDALTKPPAAGSQEGTR